MQHTAFRELLVHRERQTRKQVKTVSCCRDDSLDLGVERIFKSSFKVASAVAHTQLLEETQCPPELPWVAEAGPGLKPTPVELSNPLLSSRYGLLLGLYVFCVFFLISSNIIT